MYQDIEQLERLLRLIYRPSNAYCIHVDKKSNSTFHDAVKAIAACLPNVILPPASYDVIRGHVSLLRATLLCMKSLHERFTKWKYFINLTGHELPLVTNLGLVTVLEALNGSNSIAAYRDR